MGVVNWSMCAKTPPLPLTVFIVLRAGRKGAAAEHSEHSLLIYSQFFRPFYWHFVPAEGHCALTTRQLHYPCFLIRNLLKTV